MTMPLRLSLMLVLIFVLSACGLTTKPVVIPPTKVPPTPFSTHLPPVATPIPAGFDENNPVQLVLVGDDEEAANALEEELNTLTDVTVRVVLVENQTAAMAALCASGNGGVSAAWLSGASYPAAKQCGAITLQAETGNADESTTGEAGVLVIGAEFAEDGLSAALAENFCRISVSDFYSWLLPQMLIAAQGIDPTTIADVNEVADNDALFAALNAGECAAMGMSQSAWDSFQESLPTPTPTPEGNDEDPEPQPLVVATSAEFPSAIMVFPFAADLKVINDITEALLQIDSATGRSELDAPEAEGTAEAEATAAPEGTAAADITMEASDLNALFGEGYFIPAGDFSTLDEFLESTGLNFAEIGQ